MLRRIQLLVCALILLALHAQEVNAARIEIDPAGAPSIVVEISGTIVQGDAAKLLLIVRALGGKLLGISLNSPGGSVGEAMLMADVVRTAGLQASVQAGGSCASACFFLYLAGAHRSASGRDTASREFDQLRQIGIESSGFLGVHRPFEATMHSTDNRQETVMIEVTRYLERHFVPRQIIDIMMARPSNNIYWLSKSDIESIGSFPPQVEEFLIQRCGYTRQPPNVLLDKTAANYAQEREKFIQSIACVRTELEQHRKRGFQRINGDWNPTFR